MCFILRLNLLYFEIKYKFLELKIVDIKNCDLLSQHFFFLWKSLIKVNSSKLNEISLQVAAQLVRVGKVMEVLVEWRLGMNGKWKIYFLELFWSFLYTRLATQILHICHVKWTWKNAHKGQIIIMHALLTQPNQLNLMSILKFTCH